jgi:hypothetical protein
MIGRKLALVRNGEVVKIMHPHPFVPELQKIKKITSKGAKKIAYISLFMVLRFFIKSSNFVKTESNILAKKLIDRIQKNNSKSLGGGQKKEASKYLKTISEYRQKIKKMKHIIKKEEGIE